MCLGGSSHGNADKMSCREYNDTMDEAEDQECLDIFGSNNCTRCLTEIKKIRHRTGWYLKDKQSNICTT